MANGPLHGIRVLEFSLVYAAPWAGMTLADMGADVIKVEPPGGEPIRNALAVVPGVGGKMFTWVNRGKRSLVLDLRDERARAVVHRLVRDIDVVLINYRPGVAQRYAIDYPTLSRIRPELVYAEITGFGDSGPLAGQGSTDIIAQSYGGMTAAVGKLDPHGAPWTMNIGAGDVSGGAAAVLGIVSALYSREETGVGQFIEVSLLRTVMSSTGWLNMHDEANDAVDVGPLRSRIRELAAGGCSYEQLLAASRAARGRAESPYYASYATSDGAITLGCTTADQQERCRRALGGVDAAAGAELAEAAAGRLRSILAGNTSAYWLALFDAHDVPAAPVHLAELVASDPQAPYLMSEVSHPLLGEQRQVGPVVQMSRTATAPVGPAALLGQHADEILSEFGYSAEAIAELRAANVLG